MMLCGIFLLLMLSGCEGARLAGKRRNSFLKLAFINCKIKCLPTYISDTDCSFISALSSTFSIYFPYILLLLAHFSNKKPDYNLSLWLFSCTLLLYEKK